MENGGGQLILDSYKASGSDTQVLYYVYWIYGYYLLLMLPSRNSLEFLNMVYWRMYVRYYKNYQDKN